MENNELWTSTEKFKLPLKPLNDYVVLILTDSQFKLIQLQDRFLNIPGMHRYTNLGIIRDVIRTVSFAKSQANGIRTIVRYIRQLT